MRTEDKFRSGMYRRIISLNLRLYPGEWFILTDHNQKVETEIALFLVMRFGELQNCHGQE